MRRVQTKSLLWNIAGTVTGLAVVKSGVCFVMSWMRGMILSQSAPEFRINSTASDVRFNRKSIWGHSDNALAKVQPSCCGCDTKRRKLAK
eukprot:SAG11_NODE_161_length_14021_cov_36.845065_10_plen_90_part_00